MRDDTLATYPPLCLVARLSDGGRGEIRTHDTLAGMPVFKTGALNHSATLPALEIKYLANRAGSN
jgi:hypothetical protein